MGKWLAIFMLVFAAAAGAGVAEDSARFLGAPYAPDPLGEGRAPDTDPLWRFDAFDCVTYVETVLALQEDDFERAMDGIRYRGGEVGFLSRNHFMNPDWLKGNAQLVEDITGRVPGFRTRVRKTTVDKKGWLAKARGIDADFEPEETSLDYIAIADILANREKFAAAIPGPAIANIVVEEKDAAEKHGTDNDIAHLGFLIPKDGALAFRHASSWRKRVVEDDFFKYLEFLNRYKKYIGVNLQRIR